MIEKDNLLRPIETFLDEIFINEVIERLIIIAKLETSIKESDSDETISEAETQIEKETWSK